MHTKKFVMYFHLDDKSYKLARVVSLSAPLLADDDGTAYLIFESRPTKGFFIAKLTSNDLGIAEKTSFVGAPLEGGDLVHLGDWYYIIGSHMTCWHPNPDVYAVAHSLEVPLVELSGHRPARDQYLRIAADHALQIASHQKTSVIYMGDVWEPKRFETRAISGCRSTWRGKIVSFTSSTMEMEVKPG